MPINFGLLQTPTSPVQTQVIQRPNTGLQQEQSLISGANSFNSAVNEGQRTAIEKQNSDSAIAQRNLEMSKLKQLLPGELQAQQLDLQGKGLLNQTAQMQLNAAQLDAKNRQDRIQTYESAKAAGGTDAGVEAVKNKYMDQGDIDSALKISATQENLTKLKVDNDKSGILSIGSSIHGVVADATPASVNPQTGQIIPARTPLDVYSARYPLISKQYPNAPKPSSFKDNAQFEDTFVHPVLDNALPFQKEVAVKQDAMMKSNTYKAGLVVDSAKSDLKQIIQSKGADSEEAKDAATKLQQAQDNARLVSGGSNYVTSSIAAPIRAIGRAMGMGDTEDNLIKENMPGAKSVQQPNGTVSLQKGQMKPTLPPGVTPEMIQQELMRRQSLQGK